MAGPRRFNDPLQDIADAQQAAPQPMPGMGGVSPGMDVLRPDTPEPFAEAPMARRPDRPREAAKVKQGLKGEAAAWGDKWMWGWEVNDKRRGKIWIEGPTVKMANAIVRQYGNCVLDSRVFDLGSRWMIYARFIDLETGYTRVRPFAQRKSIDMGLKDDARALDMAFQSAVSRAERNVVVNALPELVEFCKDEAKNALYAEITKDPEKVRKWVVKQMGELGIDRAKCERAYGRTMEHWTVPDLARIVTEVESVKDGMVNALDLYGATMDDSGGPEETPTKAAGTTTTARAASPAAQQTPQQSPPAAGQGAAPAAATTATPKKASAGPEEAWLFSEKGEHLGNMDKEAAKGLSVNDPLQLDSGLYIVVKIKIDDAKGEVRVIVKKQEVVTAPPRASGETQQQQAAPPPVSETRREPAAPKRSLFSKKG